MVETKLKNVRIDPTICGLWLRNYLWGFSQGARGFFFHDTFLFWIFSFSSLWSHYLWTSLIIHQSTLFKLVSYIYKSVKAFLRVLLRFKSNWRKNARQTAVGEDVLTNSFCIHIFSVYEIISIWIGDSGSSFPVDFRESYDRRVNLHSLCTWWGMYDTILSF